ncbi:MAG TPA: hypothetical protein VFB41_02030 [Solirubrobacteraceae bacterium]|nr:hypothetical protein [Solirubrobacteraceae bacterium]
MSRVAVLLLAVTSVVALSGCAGAGGGHSDEIPSSRPSLDGTNARPPAPVTAGTLATIADGHVAQSRLAYVNVTALRAAELPVGAGDVVSRVLGEPGAARLDRVVAGSVKTAVQLGPGVTVLRGAGVKGISGRRSGADGVVIGASGGLASRLAGTRPERSAITPMAPSAVQSCLGETLAQTLLGPATMGRDAALGVGIAESGDDPAGIQLRICGAPHLIRQIHAMADALRRRFGGVGVGTASRTRVEEREIGEREMVAAVIAAGKLDAGDLLALLAAGPELRGLAWR